MSNRPGGDDPSTLVRHFGGVVKAGPVEPRPDRPKRRSETFVELPTALQEKLAKLLAEALIADYQNRLKRWAKVQPVISPDFEIPRWRVHLGALKGEGRSPCPALIGSG